MPETIEVGTRVRYVCAARTHEGVVREVRQTTYVWIDWTSPLPQPFFRGPYRPDELVVVPDTEEGS
jgi:hypothetical protein